LSTTKRADGDPAIHLRFDDTKLLPMLFGEHDRNLARIEQALGVSLHSLGNTLTISGADGDVGTARAALDALHRRLKQGLEVDAGEVDAAVRMALDAARAGNNKDLDAFAGDALTVRTRKRAISPRSPTQSAYLRAMQDHDMVFGLGPAGTGKTYLAVAVAVSMLSAGQVDRIVLSRPAVEAGERLGFLPGDMRDKIDPYLQPLYDALHDMLPAPQVVKRLESGEIEIAPLAFMRGRTLANAFIIVDEAQNTTRMQMKMLLTRLGENARMVITGDMTQIDLPQGASSGLIEAIDILGDVAGIAMVHFSDRDVVRNPLVARIVRAYDTLDAKQRAPVKKPRAAKPGRAAKR
jgi:phosphate starvation-inducible protein PhoH and related proteins